MDFNDDVTARFAVDQHFYQGSNNTHFLGGYNNFNEAIGFVLGLELDGSNYYSIWDRQTKQEVFISSEHGYSGYGSEDEIPHTPAQS